jgi:hypothetical protein
MYTGPNVTNDNLVFGYDTGYGVADNTTVTRFYPGEPTTNVLTTANASTTASWGASNTGSTTGAVTFLVEDGMPFMRLNNVTYVSGYPRFTGQVFANSATVTGGFSTSFEARGTTGASLKLKIYDNGSTKITNTATLTDTWTRYTFDNQSTSHNLNQPYFNPNTSNAIYDIRNVQIEAKSHSTPFVSGSRSNTASLIDLKRTEDISVANVSFDSTGQPEFDGTDDIIEVSRQIDTANYSAEFVFKASVNTSGTEHWLGAQYIATTGRIVFDLYTDNTLRNFISGTSITGGTTIATGVWYHAVFTRDSSGSAKIYLNGAQDATGTVSTATPLNTNFQIGGSTVLNSKEFTGNIAVVKVYNKVLSAAEVTQNYNAYKNRFNI